jgi:hypothetical protein
MSNVSINHSTVNGTTGPQYNHNYEIIDRRTESTINNNTTNNYKFKISLLDTDKLIWLARKGHELAGSIAGIGVMLSRKVFLYTRRYVRHSWSRGIVSFTNAT